MLLLDTARVVVRTRECIDDAWLAARIAAAATCPRRSRDDPPRVLENRGGDFSMAKKKGGKKKGTKKKAAKKKK
jgi:hypothetical protein